MGKKQAIECANYKCKKRMWKSDLIDGKSDGFSTHLVCPKCGGEIYYHLTDRQTKNWLNKLEKPATVKFDCASNGMIYPGAMCGAMIVRDKSCGAEPGTECEHRIPMGASFYDNR